MMRVLRLIAVYLVLALPAAAQQQLPATLIADDIRFARLNNSVVAAGNVEVLYRGTRLQAAAIRYDGTDDLITVEGPITLTEADGSTIILADFAELSRDLQQGVLQSARLVLDRQLQIAATQINRVDGRYTQLYQTIASSCQVCAANPVPLWEIRARRIVHDTEERQLYFEEAQFRAAGIPIMYLPRLRLPDPTLERSTGFLTPQIRANNQIGTGIRVPYFITLGDHADVTLTPYVTFGESQTLEMRYRQAFRNGFVELNGAMSWDELNEETPRSYLFATGWFDLPRDFLLTFDYQTVSDPAYLLTYDYSDEDRLNSHITVARARRDEYFEASVTRFRSLRDSDNNFTLPTLMTDAEIIRRYAPDYIGGIATLGLSTHSHQRRSDSDMTGRDVARLSLDARWRRDWVLPAGVLAGLELGWIGDIYNIRQDSTFDDVVTRTTPFVAAELRWPLVRANTNGVSHLVEPVLQYVWAPDSTTAVPNEDSGVVEFDEGNLFSLNRFPGADGHEIGQRLAFGLTYTRDDPLGWNLGVTVGRVWRDDNYRQFTQGSGLDGRRSDWLVSASVEVGTGFLLMNRAIFSDEFNVTSNEFSLGWQGAQFDVASSVTWLQADPVEGRNQDIAEWSFDAAYEFDSPWGASVDWRYDFEANEPTRAGLAVTYATECVDVEFSLSRRFTTSATLAPATDFGLTVALNGFGASRDGRQYARSCQ